MEKWYVYKDKGGVTIALVTISTQNETKNCKGYSCIMDVPDMSLYVKNKYLFDTYDEAFQYFKNEYEEK